MSVDELLKQTEPWTAFSHWWDFARQHAGLKEPTAMTLATVSGNLRPSLRTVLLKSFSANQGFVFFTNYDSRKGQELTQNPYAALLFYWDALFRQIKVKGEVQRLPRIESEAYWRSRPRESQISAWTSKQSQPVPKGASLDELWKHTEQKFADSEIPCPPNWGGYSLWPQEIEFWLGQPHRLHDRVIFTRQADAWRAERHFP